MAVTSIGGVSAEAVPSTTNSLGQEEFMKILLTQLTYQDPLKPLDNQEFIAQLAQFTSLEQTRQMNAGIDTLLTMQSSNQAVGLLNKTVEVDGESGRTVGTVTTLNFRDGQPFLTVKTAEGAFVTDISLSQITVIR
ncbi:flagellar basal-body rod modification protein FlgD [Paucimonas lemoignei]|uniref:Basal-body rod modification protein FlgD n=1 Tax=Paucimonas lemoignei TaxID=29443 RepID=A0A4R3HWQ7_PAULE|nr:flagellar hook capping FlgD N-terminal domain-containing protein [Paucimonas lemoignei]TCS37727.1 flagellar basal-body rod modification protein FlgD [Paucimonas lemoignei]